ncbi:protein FAM166C [Cygnus olor]|uniref:protein FAM166C n=1 Tax=Cygnus olor TaxID=8869 RepID=UPI001ADE6AE6|nr:protein FAM166C [Cygnus olor]
MAHHPAHPRTTTMTQPRSPQPPAPYPEEVPRTPLRTHFDLDGGRALELGRFYQLAQQHREFYQDKTGTLYPVPYFVLPVKEKERDPHPLDLPPLSGKTRWHLLRVSPENLRTYQTFPSGKRVTSEEREVRDSFFEYRA